MKLSSLIFIFSVTVQHARAQWLTMDQFNVWENIIKNEYDLSPDSIVSQQRALTKEEILRQNQHMLDGFESVVQSGLTLLRYPRANLNYIDVDKKGGKLSNRERAKINVQNEKIKQEKERYVDARRHAATDLLIYHYNYPKLVSDSDFIIREIKRTIYIDNIRSNLKEQVKVLSLLRISQSLQDSLLQLPGLSHEVRAKLGDTKAEQTVIGEFKMAVVDTVLNTPVIIEKVRSLFFIDSENAQNAFVEALNCKVEKFGRSPGESNFRIYSVYPAAEILLMAYEDYFPHDLLYFQEYVYKHPKLYQADARAGFSSTNNRSSFYYRVLSEYFSKKFSAQVSIPFNYRMREIYQNTEK